MAWTEQDKQDMINRISQLDFSDQMKFPEIVRNGLRGFTIDEANLYMKLRQKWSSSKARSQTAMIQELPDDWQKIFPNDVRLGKRDMTMQERYRYYQMIENL